MLETEDRTAVSNQTVWDDAALEWSEILEKMWTMIGKPVDEKRLGFYIDELGDIPIGLLEKAVSRAVRNNGQYMTVPSVGAIWNALRAELGNPSGDILEAVEQWAASSFSRCVVRF